MINYALRDPSSRFNPKLKLTAMLACGLLIAFPAVYAETEISNRETLVTESIPKPAHIWVYDFAATPKDVPPESALADQAQSATTTPTDDELATGRKLGAEIADELTKQINAMGLAASHATADSKPQTDDLVIHGYILSITEGDAKKRVSIGFGKGASELQTAVEGFQVTPTGLRKLGGGNLNAKGSKAPGAAMGAVGVVTMHNPLGLIVSGAKKKHDEKTGSATVEGRARQTAEEIATQLKPRFQQQGWIEKD